MTYDGKRPEEMSQTELENALIYCYGHLRQAQHVYQLNSAAIAELSEEMDRRESPKALN